MKQKNLSEIHFSKGLIDCTAIDYASQKVPFPKGTKELIQEIKSNYTKDYSLKKSTRDFLSSKIDSVLVIDCYVPKVIGHWDKAGRNLDFWSNFFNEKNLYLGQTFIVCFRSLFLFMEGKINRAAEQANDVFQALNKSVQFNNIDSSFLDLPKILSSYIEAASLYTLANYNSCRKVLKRANLLALKSSEKGAFERPFLKCLRAGIELYYGKLDLQDENYDKAYAKFCTAEDLYIKNRSILGPSDVKVEQARLFYQRAKFEEAISIFEQCNQVYDEYNANDRKANTLNYMARAYYKLGDLATCKKHLEDCRDLLKKGGNTGLVRKNLVLTGETRSRVYIANYDYEKALDTLDEVSFYAEDSGMMEEFAYCHTWKAMVSREKGDNLSSQFEASVALSYFKQVEVPEKGKKKAQIQLVLAEILRGKRNLDYLERSILDVIDTYHRIGNINDAIEACVDVSFVFFCKNHVQAASSYLKKGLNLLFLNTNFSESHKFLSTAAYRLLLLGLLFDYINKNEDNSRFCEKYIMGEQFTQLIKLNECRDWQFFVISAVLHSIIGNYEYQRKSKGTNSNSLNIWSDANKFSKGWDNSALFLKKYLYYRILPIFHDEQESLNTLQKIIADIKDSECESQLKAELTKCVSSLLHEQILYYKQVQTAKHALVSILIKNFGHAQEKEKQLNLKYLRNDKTLRITAEKYLIDNTNPYRVNLEILKNFKLIGWWEELNITQYSDAPWNEKILFLADYCNLDIKEISQILVINGKDTNKILLDGKSEGMQLKYFSHLLSILSYFLRLAKYQPIIVRVLWEKTNLFKFSSDPPPWDRIGIKNYLKRHKLTALEKSYSWLRGNTK